MTPQPLQGSLIVVGTGITGVGQITLEAAAAIENAQKLFYISNHPTTEFWLKQRNATATTLSDLYDDGKPRSVTYREMTDRIVTAVRSGLEVCVAIYGHPGVFVQCTHAAIAALRTDGYSARMLPGVSADGCLFADVGFNPGDQGIQTFEATNFLLTRKAWDPTSGLLLWQIGVLGELDMATARRCRPDRLQVLVEVLAPHYPADHSVILYQAASFPGTDPAIQRLPIEALPTALVSPQATLFVPPLPQQVREPRVVTWFREEMALMR
jgi:uncharacterized protein YabN with tetrapyrrole methylase and pyrophosphatase domain